MLSGSDLVRSLSGPGSSVVVYDAKLQQVAATSPFDSGDANDSTSLVAVPELAATDLAASLKLPRNEADVRVLRVDGTRLLVQLLPIYLGAPGSEQVVGVLQLNTSLAQADTLLGQLVGLLGLGLLVALLAALALGAPLTRLTLRPLDRVAAAADRLAAGDLASRVTVPPQRDEIGRLAVAFNRMAGQVENGFARQRRFVADASHELKTPLTALGGEVEMLQMGVADGNPAVRQQLLVSMDKEIGRMGRLVNDLLTLSRMDDPTGYPLHAAPLDLRLLVTETATQVAALAPQHAVSSDVPDALVCVQGDADRLRQILLNLGDNARKFTPPGGHIQFGLRTEGGRAVATVSDNGPGIASEQQPYIFERFYRADASRQRKDSGGAGLGLSIAAAISHAHNGTLAVSSQPGQGATFVLTLPLAEL